MEHTIFASYVKENEDIFNKIRPILAGAGFQKVRKLTVAPNNDSSESTPKIGDIIIILASKNYLASECTQNDLEATLANNGKYVFIVKVDENLVLPPLFSNPNVKFITYKMKNNLFDARTFLAEFTKFVSKNITDVNYNNNSLFHASAADIIKQINTALASLSKPYAGNKLTLVCGAGVSASAGLPEWDAYLGRMLEATFPHYTFNKEMKSFLTTSSLIVAEYLRIVHEDNFNNIASNSLYFDSKLGEGSELMYEVANIVSSKNGSLDSIITFNFDLMLEECLDKVSKPYKIIDREGMDISTDEIPIYHVHGVLPRDITGRELMLVFSEYGYHTQFMDPYSWSNMVQLYKYMNSTCLFVGVSLKDPNLRRLLEITKRKNENGLNRHYLLKKLPDSKSKIVFDLHIKLEEEDASRRGLNLIWYQSHDQVPKILSCLKTGAELM